MRRRVLWLSAWLVGAVAVSVWLWPSRYRPWPVPNGGAVVPVPGTHHIDSLATLSESVTPQGEPAASGRWERWDLDTGTRVSVGAELPAYQYEDWRYGYAGPKACVVRPADEPDASPLRLITWPTGRELGRHPSPAHLFVVGEPGDGLYAVGLPTADALNSAPATEADLAVPWQVHIHEVGTGRRLRSLPGAAFHIPVTRGRLLVTVEPRELVPAGTIQTLSVWDVTDGRRVRAIPLGPSTLRRLPDVYLSGNGRYLLSASGQVWEVATGAEVRPAHQGEMAMTAQSGEGRWLLQVDYGGTATWFDAETGGERIDYHRLPVPSYGEGGGGARSIGPWEGGRIFVARAQNPLPNRVQRWLSYNLPALFPPTTDYDWHDFRVLDPATGRAVVSAPVFANQGTEDGVLLFVTGPDGKPRLYFTGRLVPWTAALGVLAWTLLLLAVARSVGGRRIVTPRPPTTG